MSANTHAAILLGLAVATVAICVGTPKTRKKWLRGVVGVILGAGTADFIMQHHDHMCSRGLPASQCLIGACCVALVIIFVRSRTIMLLAVIVLMGATELLSRHYVHLVHNGWVCSPEGVRDIEPWNRKVESNIRNRLMQIAESNRIIHPAGWLRDIPPIVDDLPTWAISSWVHRVEVSSAWHSSFTRLYRCRRHYVDLWYPGGAIKDTANSVVLKDRPERRPGEADAKK